MAEKPTSSEAREAAAIRRRWITLGEVLAVVAVIISGLTLWNSYSERARVEAEKRAEKQEARVRAQRLILRGTAADEGKRIDVAPTDSEQVLQGMTIAFPSVLSANAIDSIVEPRIEADWLDKAITNLRRAERRSKQQEGDQRLPVLITARFVKAGENYSDVSIYDIGYNVDSNFLQGTEIKLSGLSHIERVSASTGAARLNRLWSERHGAVAK